MIKDPRDMDDLFRSGLDTLEETPSARVKERLDALLDEKAAETHKKRLPGWKRTALLLLTLLSGLIIYETDFLKPGSHRQSKIAGRANNKEAINKIINNNAPAVSRVGKKEISASRSEPAKGFNDSPTSIYFLPVEKINPTLLKTENETIKINDKAPNSIKQLQTTIDSVLKIGAVIKSTENNKEFYRPRWMITGYASYDQAGYQLDSDEPSAITSVKHQEAHEPSFSLGLLLTRQVTKRWGLQSGLTYSNSAIGMKPQKTYAFKDPTGDVAYKYITSFGYAFIKPGFSQQPLVGDSLTTAEAKHTMENITVPLVIKYTVLDKKISITPGAGIEANFITKANLEVEIEDAANSEIVFVRRLNGTKSFYWSFVLDADLRYNLNNKLSLTARPIYRHSISPITKNNIVETFPYSFGLGVGLTIKF